MSTAADKAGWSEQLQELAGLRGQDARLRQQNALLAFGRHSSARPHWTTLLQDAASLLTEVLESDLGCTAVVSGDGSMVVVNLTRTDLFGKPEQVLERSLPVESDSSIAGYAMHTATPVVLSDLAQEHRFRDPLLEELSVASGLVVPLPVAERPFGTIGVFSLRQREFVLDDVHFAETISYLLSASVGRLRAEEQLEQQLALSGAVLDTIEGLVVVLDADGRITRVNRAAREISGFSPNELYDRPLHAVLLPGNEAAAVREVFGQLRHEPKDMETTLLRKHAAAVRVRWTCRPVTPRNGTLQSIVLTGTLAEAPTAGEPPPLEPAAPPEQAFARMTAVPTGEELRTSPRRSFQFRQSIAPMYGSSLPSRNKFFEVDCKDISAGGISFFLNQHPDFTSLLVALGRPPGITYFTARVVRVIQQEVDGKARYMIGCRFIGRVHL